MGYIVDGMRRGSNIHVEGFGYVRNHPLHLKPEHIKALRARGCKMIEAPDLVSGEERDLELATAAENDRVNASQKQATEAANAAALVDQMRRESAAVRG